MAAASSSTVPAFFGFREEDDRSNQMKQPSSVPSSLVGAAAGPTAPAKKKRNLPGIPNPDAEVIALSPKTLMATNRFVCEVCSKGFQREQNLQLHRRGHNLPWKLKQKSGTEVRRRRVYLCPEPTCAHHDPSRALGDLTGIKKHFSRKHGEKKWKCDKCSKRYAVQSDWKAHSKTCGTREYRCDCGTLFSRRDSFITHRTFCDALAQESARLPARLNAIGSHLYGNSNVGLGLAQMDSQVSSLHGVSHPSDLLRLGGSGGGDQFDSPSNPSALRPPRHPHSSAFYLGGSYQGFGEDAQSHQSLLRNKPFHCLTQLPADLQSCNPIASSSTAAANLFDLSFFSNGSSGGSALFPSGDLLSDHNIRAGVSSLYDASMPNEPLLPHMSATALLQKAAQMGATTSSGSSMHRGFGSFRSRTEDETHLQELMNSLANGNSGGFSGSGGAAAFGGDFTSGGEQEQENGLRRFSAGLCEMDEAKFQHGLSGVSFGASDGLTRDFLGVGSMMRSMGGGGISQREEHLGIDMGLFDPEMKPAASSRSFISGNLQ